MRALTEARRRRQRIKRHAAQVMRRYRVEIDGEVHGWADAVYAIANPYRTNCGLTWHGTGGARETGRLYGDRTERPLTCERCKLEILTRRAEWSEYL